MPFHHGINLCSQGLSLKMLFSGYLTIVAIGYLMAAVQILFTHGMADGQFGLSVDDIVYSYYGKRSGSVIEGKLNGSMQAMAPEEERLKIINWVRKGAGSIPYSLRPTSRELSIWVSPPTTWQDTFYWETRKSEGNWKNPGRSNCPPMTG